MNRSINLDKLECYIKNVRYELKNVLKKIDEKITEPARLKYTTPHYCPYCGELSLSEPHEIIKCSSCDMRFRLAKVQKEYPPIADLDDIDIMEIEADENGNVDLAKIEDVNEIITTEGVDIGQFNDKSSEVDNNKSEYIKNIYKYPNVDIKTYDPSQGQSPPGTEVKHLPLRNFLIWLFNVVGEKTKTLTYYNVSALRSEFLRCMPNMCMPWTHVEIENLKQSPELFHLNNEDETIKWVGESWIDSLNTVKELCGYPSNLIKEIDDVIQHIQDYVVFVETSKDNEKPKNAK